MPALDGSERGGVSVLHGEENSELQYKHPPLGGRQIWFNTVEIVSTPFNNNSTTGSNHLYLVMTERTNGENKCPTHYHLKLHLYSEGLEYIIIFGYYIKHSSNLRNL